MHVSVDFQLDILTPRARRSLPIALHSFASHATAPDEPRVWSCNTICGIAEAAAIVLSNNAQTTCSFLENSISLVRCVANDTAVTVATHSS